MVLRRRDRRNRPLAAAPHSRVLRFATTIATPAQTPRPSRSPLRPAEISVALWRAHCFSLFRVCSRPDTFHQRNSPHTWYANSQEFRDRQASQRPQGGRQSFARKLLHFNREGRSLGVALAIVGCERVRRGFLW